MSPKEIIEAYRALSEEYLEAKNEAYFCGYEFPTFEVWCGEEDPKEAAQARWLQREEDDTLDLF